jgi:uncharacterized protein (DUF4415 family)
MAAADNRIGDKVLVTLSQSKVRGTIKKSFKESLKVETDDGELMSVDRSAVRNFSAAARMAWKRMPERKVGRPKGSSKAARVSVTLRLDRALWSKFLLLEAQQQIQDRTALFNGFLAEVTAEKNQRRADVVDIGRKGQTL